MQISHLQPMLTGLRICTFTLLVAAIVGAAAEHLNERNAQPARHQLHIWLGSEEIGIVGKGNRRVDLVFNPAKDLATVF